MESPRDENFITKKMEEMKRRNEEILKRHMEIEQDKMLADQFSSTAKPTQRKEAKMERGIPSNSARSQRNRVPPGDRQSAFQSKETDERRYHRFSENDGPPPDPNFNFLSDPSRNRTESQSSEENWRNSNKSSNDTWGKSRRHRNNYGGQDFKNVKSTMQKHKSSFKKELAEASQRSGNLTMQMTGRERIQYEEWKKERDKVDQERIQRQRTSTGTWRREWDSHKAVGFDFDEEQHKLEIQDLCEQFKQQLKPKQSVQRPGSFEQSQKLELCHVNRNVNESETVQNQVSREQPRRICQEGGKISVVLKNQPKVRSVEMESQNTSVTDTQATSKEKLHKEASLKSASHCWTFKPDINKWSKCKDNVSKQLLARETVCKDNTANNLPCPTTTLKQPTERKKRSHSWTFLKPEVPISTDTQSKFAQILEWRSSIAQNLYPGGQEINNNLVNDVAEDQNSCSCSPPLPDSENAVQVKPLEIKRVPKKEQCLYSTPRHSSLPAKTSKGSSDTQLSSEHSRLSENVTTATSEDFVKLQKVFRSQDPTSKSDFRCWTILKPDIAKWKKSEDGFPKLLSYVLPNERKCEDSTANNLSHSTIFSKEPIQQKLYEETGTKKWSHSWTIPEKINIQSNTSHIPDCDSSVSKNIHPDWERNNCLNKSQDSQHTEVHNSKSAVQKIIVTKQMSEEPEINNSSDQNAVIQSSNEVIFLKELICKETVSTERPFKDMQNCKNLESGDFGDEIYYSDEDNEYFFETEVFQSDTDS